MDKDGDARDSKFIFRINDNGQGVNFLRKVCLERGWEAWDPFRHRSHEWNLWWRSKRFPLADYKNTRAWQRFNHFPKSSGITKKDCLARNVRRMKAVYGSSVYNFCPESFNVPNDYTKYVAEYTRLKQSNETKDTLWICKPAELSCGRGIFIFRELSSFRYSCNAVVQKYISNPLLISGYKCDLRLYVVIACYDPLTIYIHKEGLVRFGTAKYNLKTLGNRYSHLTNTSLNKNSPAYLDQKEQVGYGCKWKLSSLFNYLKVNNISHESLWPRIRNIIVLTIIMQIPEVPKNNNCFELLGFDILLDENLKPWLLEVNFSPSLAIECDVDVAVKKPLLNDILDLLQLKSNDKRRKEPSSDLYRSPSVTSHIQRHRFSKKAWGSGNNLNVGPPPNLLSEDPQCYCYVSTSEDQCHQSISTHQIRVNSFDDTPQKLFSLLNAPTFDDIKSGLGDRQSNESIFADIPELDIPESESTSVEFDLHIKNTDNDSEKFQQTNYGDHHLPTNPNRDNHSRFQINDNTDDENTDVNNDNHKFFETTVGEFRCNSYPGSKTEYSLDVLDNDNSDESDDCVSVIDICDDSQDSTIYFDCADFNRVVIPDYLHRQLYLAENQFIHDHSNCASISAAQKTNTSLSAQYEKSQKLRKLWKTNSLDANLHNLENGSHGNNTLPTNFVPLSARVPKKNDIGLQKNNTPPISSRRCSTERLKTDSTNQTIKRQKSQSKEKQEFYPINNIGGLQLIYPFNQATRRLPTCNVRGIIRETQKLLKAELSKANT